MTPTPTSGAADLPEALRVPLDSLHADAGYLCGRLLNGSLTQEQVVESIRRRIDAAKLAAITAQALSAAPADIAKLRHLYANLKNGGVRDAAQAKRIADGLLAPIIERLELYQAAPKAAPASNESAYQRGYMDGMAKGRRDAEAAPPQEVQEPVAWESTTPGYIKYITQARYEKFSPAVRRWYKPYRCSGCAERGAGFDACDIATAAAQGFRDGQSTTKQEE